MGKFAVIITILLSVLLLACASTREAGLRQSVDSAQGGESASPFLSEEGAEMRGPQGPAGPPGDVGIFDFEARPEVALEPHAAAQPTPAPSAARPPADEDGGGSGDSSSTLQTAQRRVISTASISIEVEAVQSTVNQVRTIAEGLGGFVEQLSSSGGSERQRANLTIRVPQDQFFPALERLEGLGEVQNRNVGSEDVSERFIDLEARLKSSLREEESLLNLLERATQVSEILTIERELNRVRSEIERFQGQLNFLERRVALATISVSLFPPAADNPEPPSASLVVEQPKVSSRVNEVKNMVSSFDGEVDRVFISSRDGRERADISFRVFPKDFGQAVEFLEGSGKVRSKELREGTGNPSAQSVQPDEPNSVIGVSLIEPEPSNTGLIIAIAAPIGGLVLAGGLASAFFFTYQAGRHRRDRFAQTTG